MGRVVCSLWCVCERERGRCTLTFPCMIRRTVRVTEGPSSALVSTAAMVAEVVVVVAAAAVGGRTGQGTMVAGSGTGTEGRCTNRHRGVGGHDQGLDRRDEQKQTRPSAREYRQSTA